MISLLTSLKPFCGDVAALQENALSNWRALDGGLDGLEIILYGAGEGIIERARRFGVKHSADVRCNETGVPDFAALAEHAAQHALHDTQVYLNGDILLPPDFIAQLRSIPLSRYLITGQRIDLAREADFDPLARDWAGEIRQCAAAGQATVRGPVAQDYFVFPRGLWRGLGPLIVGRGSYDNALLAFCLRRRIPIIDATWSIPVVHQWHDHAHLAGTAEAKSKADTLRNKQRHDILHSNPDIEDANWRLIGGRIVPSRGSPNPLRRLEIVLRYRMGLKYPSYACRALTRIAWRFGFLLPRSVSIASMLRPDHPPSKAAPCR